jgi:hypothetical protein
MGETNTKTNEEVYEEAKAFQKKLLNAVGVSTAPGALAKDSMVMIKEQGDWECFCCDYEEPVRLGDSLNACLRRLKYIYLEELFEQCRRNFYGLHVCRSMWGTYSVYDNYIQIDDELKELVGYDQEKVDAFFKEVQSYKIEDGERLLPEYIQYLIALGDWSFETNEVKELSDSRIKVNFEAKMQIDSFSGLFPISWTREHYEEFTARLDGIIPKYETYIKNPKLLSPRLNPDGAVYYYTVDDDPDYTVVICYRLEDDIVKILTGFKVSKELNLTIE